MRWLLPISLCLIPSVCCLELFPVGESSLPPSDEVSSPPIPLSIPILFYGTSYESIFVSIERDKKSELQIKQYLSRLCRFTGQ